MTEAEPQDEQTTRPPPGGPAMFLVSWEALDQGLSLLANPDRVEQVPIMLSALRRLQGATPPDKLLLQILGVAAWLTSDDPLPGGEAAMT